jgi:transcriptional regulator GlxA family with amidase domain
MAERQLTLKFRKAKDLLDRDYCRDWTVAKLADAVALPPAELRSLFIARIGMPPDKYLIDVRVNAAKDLLIGGKSVTEVARLCGFETVSSLSGHFFRRTGTHASHYRFKMVGWKHGPAAIERRTQAPAR